MASRRSVLLPPYLSSNPAWQQLVESIDEVLASNVDTPIAFLQKLRDSWILLPSADAAISGHNLLNTNEGFYNVDRETLIRQANMIGFLFKESDLLSDEDYRRIVRNLGTYWYGKGTPNFIDFLAFCMNNTLTIVKLWSTPGATYGTYGPLFEEGAVEIGLPNYEGGDWFETSHVHLIVDPNKFPSSAVPKLVALFNTLANYDLVLDAVVFDTTSHIHAPGEETAEISQAYPMVDITELIYTTATRAPTANFDFEYSSTGVGSVKFYDVSTQQPDTWTWDFDNGVMTSSEQNPFVVFEVSGDHQVTLTVSNSLGSDSATQTVTITAPMGPNFAVTMAYFTLFDTDDRLGFMSDLFIQNQLGGQTGFGAIVSTDLDELAAGEAPITVACFVMGKVGFSPTPSMIKLVMQGTTGVPPASACTSIRFTDKDGTVRTLPVEDSSGTYPADNQREFHFSAIDDDYWFTAGQTYTIEVLTA